MYEVAVDTAKRPSPDRKPLPGDAWDTPTRSMVYDLREYWTSAMSIIDEVDADKFLKVAAFTAGLHLPDMAKAHNEYQHSLITLIENNSHFSKMSSSQMSKVITEEIERGTEWKFHTGISNSVGIRNFNI